MTDHDRLFKELLTVFFVEFRTLFLPDVAGYIDPESIEFLDKEIFTDVTSGESHEVDLVAKVRLRDEPAFLLVHVENQATPQERFPRRMFRYFARLDEKYDLPICPIAVFTYDAPARAEPDQYLVALPGRKVSEFNFQVIQLNRLNWRDFLRNPNPVASALMAKMRIAPEDRPRVKLECLRMLATLRLDRARTRLISGFVDSYLTLNDQENRQFVSELHAAGLAEEETVVEIMTSWKREGIEQGRQEGREEGRREGIAALVVDLIRHRFGEPSDALLDVIQALPTDRLQAFGGAMLDFADLSEAEAWLDAARGKRSG